MIFIAQKGDSMFFNILNRLSDNHKGILMIAAGAILLLHTMGIIQTGLSFLIIIGSIMLIVYGFFKAGYDKRLINLLQTTQKK